MLTSLRTPLRALFLVAALAFAAQTADARPTAPEPQTTTTRSTARTKGETAKADGVSVDGLLIIVGIIGAVIVLAWACSRVGDSR
jgi:hypothetical protein